MAVGAVVGGSARYAIARAVPTATDGFPTATLVTNLAATFLLALLGAILLRRLLWNDRLRVFLVVGMLGSFSTFSTFAVEIDVRVRDRHVGIALGYLAASMLGGALAGWAGLAIGRAMSERPDG